MRTLQAPVLARGWHGRWSRFVRLRARVHLGNRHHGRCAGRRVRWRRPELRLDALAGCSGALQAAGTRGRAHRNECGRRDCSGAALRGRRFERHRRISGIKERREDASILCCRPRRRSGAGNAMKPYDLPDASGHFGQYGGVFVAETLMHALEELRHAYERYRNDADFNAELLRELTHYVGRPSPIYHARRWSEELGGAQIYLKREDLNHTGAHKINNTVGQAMLAKRMGKPRVIAETGA